MRVEITGRVIHQRVLLEWSVLLGHHHGHKFCNKNHANQLNSIDILRGYKCSWSYTKQQLFATQLDKIKVIVEMENKVLACKYFVHETTGYSQSCLFNCFLLSNSSVMNIMKPKKFIADIKTVNELT